MANNDYAEFNDFQLAFYTNKTKFAEYSFHEVKKHSYALLSNLAKGFPYLANSVLNWKGFGWSGTTSKSILQAIQYRLFGHVPNFIYFKSNKPVVDKKSKAKKIEAGKIVYYTFDIEIKQKICEQLMIDSKTYDYLLKSPKIQEIGMQLNGEFAQVEKIKKQPAIKRKSK